MLSAATSGVLSAAASGVLSSAASGGSATAAGHESRFKTAPFSATVTVTGVNFDRKECGYQPAHTQKAPVAPRHAPAFYKRAHSTFRRVVVVPEATEPLLPAGAIKSSTGAETEVAAVASAVAEPPFTAAARCYTKAGFFGK